MAPILLLAFALLAQDAPPATASADDGPVATAAPRRSDVAPLPIQGGPVSAPSDDYGYVGWCFGAISGYIDLYDRAMPEVIRIERAWPTPSTEENIKVVYPAQKRDAIASLDLFRRAIEAAEKASPTTIAQQGAAAIRKGRGVWTGATTVPKAQLAQFWMSWAPPAKCEETARALEARSLLFGQALTANTAVPVAAPAAPEPAAEPAALAEAAPTPLAETPVEPAVAAVAAVEAAAADDAETPTPEAPIDPVAAVETAPLVEDAPAGTDAPVVDMAEAPAAGPDADAGTAAPSAIDDLLAAPAEAEAAAEAPPAPAVPPVATPAPAAPAKAKPTRKPGLRDTLRGLRGPQ
jgi:hypothetical protein